MKRIGYLYERIISIKNCTEAIYNASHKKKKRKMVKHILDNIDKYAKELSEGLQNKTFLTPYTHKVISDGLSGKVRELEIPNFYPDQCAHHAIMQVIKPFILKSSYYWSCANIQGRGISRAAIGVERATIRDIKHSKYCVKLDIQKFYPSIPHNKLKECLQNKFKDLKALELVYQVIDSHEQGVPIGNYTSPWLAELFLQKLDWYIKHELKIKHYIRYADDMVLIGNNKRKLHRALELVRTFICSMGLQIKSNYQLFPIYRNGRGRKIDFVGRCFATGFTMIRKRRSLAFMRQSRKIQKLVKNKSVIPFRMASGFLSRSSCLKYTRSFGLKRKYYNTIKIKKLKEVIRNESKRKHIPHPFQH